MENALITGATKGIGRAIAVALAKQGINLAICSRNSTDLTNFKAELERLNPSVQIFTSVADCSNKEQLLNFASSASDKLGFISIIINNVGLYEPSSILKDEENTFEKQINTNLMPAYQLYRFFGERMVSAGKGHFFNICSAAVLQPVVNAGMYSVTKFALLGLNRVMRLEMQPYGIKVTAIIPGSTLTDSWKDAEVDKDKFVAADDIASAIVNIYKMSAGSNVDEVVIKPVGGQL